MFCKHYNASLKVFELITRVRWLTLQDCDGIQLQIALQQQESMARSQEMHVKGASEALNSGIQQIQRYTSFTYLSRRAGYMVIGNLQEPLNDQLADQPAVRRCRHDRSLCSRHAIESHGTCSSVRI